MSRHPEPSRQAVPQGTNELEGMRAGEKSEQELYLC